MHVAFGPKAILRSSFATLDPAIAGWILARPVEIGPAAPLPRLPGSFGGDEVNSYAQILSITLAILTASKSPLATLYQRAAEGDLVHHICHRLSLAVNAKTGRGDHWSKRERSSG